MRFRTTRHTHDKDPKNIRKIDELEWVQQCSCGKRRTLRQGWGTEQGTYFSRWYDSQEFNVFKELFPELFKENKK